MDLFEIILANIAFYSLTLVVLIFGLMAPWYRTFTGTVLFSVKVSLWLIVMLPFGRAYGFSPGFLHAVSVVVYFLTTASSFCLLYIMITTQLLRGGNVSRTARSLFTKEGDDTEKEAGRNR